METKSLLLSKSVRGIVIALFISITKMFGIDVIIADQAELIENIIQIVGLVIAVYGTITRSTKLVLFK